MKKCCLIVPIYNAIPTPCEKLSVSRNLGVLKKYDCFFVYPDGMCLDEYKQFGSDNVTFIAFPNVYFSSNKSYSRLILSEEFYLPFLEYEYMLIAQTDTLILSRDDEKSTDSNQTLKHFIDLGFDYYGAPWPEGPFTKPYSVKDRIKLLFISHPEKLHVGNGGFSLRKVRSSYELVKSKRLYIKYLWKFNEDMFFSHFADTLYGGYVSCDYETAKSFSLETNMKEELDRGLVVYALHAFEKNMSLEEVKKYLR